MWKLLGKLFETSIWLSRGTFWGKLSFQEQKCLSFSYFERKLLGNVAKKFESGLSKLHFMSTEERFDELSWRKSFTSSFSVYICEKTYKIWEKNYSICVKNAICVSGGTIWRKTNFGKNKIFHQFRTLGGEVSYFRQTKVSRFFNIALHVSRWTFRGPSSWKKKYFFIVATRLWANNHETFCGKKSAWSSKLHFTSAAKHLEDFLDKRFIPFYHISTSSAKKIEFLAAKMRHSRQNAVWVTTGIFWKKNDFFESYSYIYMSFLIVFELPANFFQNLSKTNSARFSGLHFTCPVEKFEQNSFFSKKNYIFHQFSKSCEKSLDFWFKKNLRGCQYWFLRVQRNNWGVFFEKVRLFLIIFEK